MTDRGWTILGVVISAIGALIALIAFLFKPPSLTPSRRNVLIAIGLTICAFGSICVVVYFAVPDRTDASTPTSDPIAPTTIALPNVPPYTTSSTGVTPSVSGPQSTLSDAPPPGTGTSPESVPLGFTSPSQGERLPPRGNTVTLSGSVPSGKHLWIFVYSSGEYFVQGAPQPTGTGNWLLDGVSLGSTTDPLDAKLSYAIYAVLADQQADQEIAQLLATTHGNTGVTDVPGGLGDSPISVAVQRSDG